MQPNLICNAKILVCIGERDMLNSVHLAWHEDCVTQLPCCGVGNMVLSDVQQGDETVT